MLALKHNLKCEAITFLKEIFVTIRSSSQSFLNLVLFFFLHIFGTWDTFSTVLVFYTR